MKGLEIEVLGVELLLTCEGSVWVPSERTLLVADLHIGKGATFRAAGVPIPSGSTLATLQSLSELAQRFEAERIIVLGDLWHAQASEVLAEWLSEQSAEVCLVPGNHDRRALGGLHPSGLCVLDEVYDLGPFRLTHHPIATSGFSICGHVHPVITLTQPIFRTRRFRCFWQTPTHLVLPSFGAFTGGTPVVRQPGHRIFLCAGSEVAELPLRGAL